MHAPGILYRAYQREIYDGFCNSVLCPYSCTSPHLFSTKKSSLTNMSQPMRLCVRRSLIYMSLVIRFGCTTSLDAFADNASRKASGSKIGFFLHIPFPSFELYRLLPKPWRVHLLLGLMGTDVAGFKPANMPNTSATVFGTSYPHFMAMIIQ